MNSMVSQITGTCNATVCPTPFSGQQQWKDQNSALLTLCYWNPPMTIPYRDAKFVSMSTRHDNNQTPTIHYNTIVYERPIYLLHKSHNAQLPFPTMHHFITEMCTCVHISVTKWCIARYLSSAMRSFVRRVWLHLTYSVCNLRPSTNAVICQNWADPILKCYSMFTGIEDVITQYVYDLLKGK